MSKKIKTIAFDIGGVVIEGCWSKNFLKNASDVLEIQQKNLRKLMDVNEPALMRGEINDIKFWRDILNEAKGENMTENKKEITDAELKKLWIELFEEYFTPRKEVLELINELRDKGYTVGCISNSIPPHTEHNIEVGLYDKEGVGPESIEGYFYPCIISDRVGKTKFEDKTGTEIFKDYLKEAGCEPEEGIFIDDEERNLKEPRKLGMHTLLYNNEGEYNENLLEFLKELEEKLETKLEITGEVKKEINKNKEVQQEFKIR